MLHSIQQIALNMGKIITQKAIGGEITDIDALAASVSEDCRAAARRILETITEEMNQQLREDKEVRRVHGLVLKEKDRPRQLLTELGMLHLKRDYYWKKDSGNYIFPLDRMIGLKHYERIGGQICAKLAEQAVEVSYAKSAMIVTGGAVSRQTVRNKILKAASPEKEPAWEGRKQVPELHIFADEDHVHMQRPEKEKGKKSQMVPLITVTEGIKQENGGRNSTICPMHFADENFNIDKLWKSAAGYIEKAYRIEDLKNIYVHGDGGSWITRGLEEFEQKKFVMDGYHFEKELKKISSRFPKQNIRKRLSEAIRRDDKDRAESVLKSLDKYAVNKRDQKELRQFSGYLLRHWDSIVRRRSGKLPGSCTEGQISHILSERFSRDPQGWSSRCLGKLSKLRVYVKNGGKITKKIFEEKDPDTDESYREYADRMLKEYLSETTDWSIFEAEPPVFDGAKGTQILIKGIGQCRNWILN